MDNTDASNRARLNAIEPGKNIEDREILVKAAKTVNEVNHDR